MGGPDPARIAQAPNSSAQVFAGANELEFLRQ